MTPPMQRGIRKAQLLVTVLALLHTLYPRQGIYFAEATTTHGVGFGSFSSNGGGGNVQGPQLTSELPSRLLYSNSSGGSLPCSATGQPAPTIRWLTEDGDEAADVPRLRHVRQGDGSLVFLPFRADQFRRDVHEARYRCSASNAIGTVVSPQVHVTAVLDTNYEIRFSDRHVLSGNSVLLQCPIPSHLADHVFVTSWQRVDGYVITKNTQGDDYLVTSDGQLYIREARDAEELLRYRCHTENTLTRRKKTSMNFVRLLLREPVAMQMPSIVHRSSRVLSDPDLPAELVCAAEGFPVPSYSWYKRDGQRMMPLESGPRVRQVAGVLQFREVEFSDGGNYVCVVSNSVGDAQADLELVVTPKPWVTVTPANVRAEVGHAAAFRCNASGLDWGAVDETSLEWRHDGRRVTPAAQQAVAMGRSRALHLASIRRQDQGMYQCFVRLSPKRTIQAAAELIVGDQAPRFKSTFDEITVRPGKPVSLRCVASGDPPPRITWSLDGVWPIDSRHGRVRVRAAGPDASSGAVGAEVSSTLSISSAEVKDGGSYVCEASNYAGMASHSARINVYGPIFVRALGNLSALAGGTFTVQCPFGGYPYGNIDWDKDGRRLPLNQRQMVFPNGTLQIQNIDHEHDQGQYTCTVHGPDSQVLHRTTLLLVRTGPQITPFGFQANLHEGMRAGLTCLVHAGDPPIRIEWLRDGKPLVPGAYPLPDVAVLSPEGGFVSTLTLPRVSSRLNGNYTCRAANEYASAEHSAELLVKVPPAWTMEPNDTTAVTGRSVYVDCQASGVPQPHIRWKSAAEPVSPASQFRTIISNSRIHILVNGTLSIRSVEPGDAGLYLCEASNGVGSGISRVLHLTVRSAPRFASKFTTVSVRRGESTEVTCPAEGDSPIRFHWLKNNLPLNVLKERRYSRMEDRNGDVTVSKISIHQVERSDNAVYTCQAANEFGEDSTNIQLTVQDVPDPPGDIDVREVGSRTARITWSTPFTGNSAITQYVLHWNTIDGLWQDTLSVSGLETKATVRGLLPTTAYQLRVRAHNALGIGEYSAPVDFTTSKEPPRFPPKNVQAMATNTRTISVSFDNPRRSSVGDEIEGFYVGYRELSSSDAFTFKTFEASPALLSAPMSHDASRIPADVGEAAGAAEPVPHRLSYELGGLRRSTEYVVTAQAFNSKGAGPQSEVVRVRTLDFDPPSAPHLRVGGTTARSISVNWENEHHQDIPITGYSLYYRTEAGGEWHEVSVPPDRRAFTLSDLRCGTEYLVYVRAANRAGKGPQGETLSVRTNGGRPVEPDSSRLFEVNSTFVVLHLDAWESGGCPVSYFVVQYRPDVHASARPSPSSSDWTLHSNNVVPQQQLVQLADLAPGTWYTLLMSAHNDAGSTEVELSFATLTLAGDVPSRRYELVDPQVAFYRHLTVTVPIVSAILVLVVVIGIVFFVLRKRNYDPRQRFNDGMVVAECCDGIKGDVMLAVSRESQARQPVYYPAPYATHTRGGAVANAASGHCNHVTGSRAGGGTDDPMSRTYDVPYPVKRLEMWEPRTETLVTGMEVYEKAGREAIYTSSPFHISKKKAQRKPWREDGDRSSGSDADTEDLPGDACNGAFPEALIIPSEKVSCRDNRLSTKDTTTSFRRSFVGTVPT
ncbi:cell adhesion molecule Dscam1-like isoform X1 [Dermacentor andersoni]|uniref:cell adhesion molecule Dscam1-like isoform X1 n=1 Tax=Dermacentor andersoni TaxID=34620 RepID=UPI002154F867|nr:cell adhesion molecule DSCAM-like isoform X1 [Dermacentor andersoni]